MKKADTQKHAHRWTEPELREFIGMYMRSVDVQTVANHFGVTVASCAKIAGRLRKEGVPLPRRTAGHIAGRRNQPWTQEEIEYLVRRRKDRATAEEIALELNRSFHGVQGMILTLRKEGVDVGMLGSGVRRLWSPERLSMACAGRGLSLVSENVDDQQVHQLRQALEKRA
jgi:transposase